MNRFRILTPPLEIGASDLCTSFPMLDLDLFATANPARKKTPSGIDSRRRVLQRSSEARLSCLGVSRFRPVALRPRFSTGLPFRSAHFEFKKSKIHTKSSLEADLVLIFHGMISTYERNCFLQDLLRGYSEILWSAQEDTMIMFITPIPL